MNDPQSPSPGPSMQGSADTITFACGGCGRQLRVGVAFVGKSAKCAQCGMVQPIPSPAAPFAGAPPLAPPTYAAAPGFAPIQQPLPQPVSQMASSYPGGAAPTPLQFPASTQPPAPVVSAPWPNQSGTPVHAAIAPPQVQLMPQPLVRSEAPRAAPSTSLTHSLDARGGQQTPTKALFDRIMAEIGKIYVGQQELVLGSLVALFSNGHVLIESVPGLGKTLFVRTLGRVLGCRFGRIQFTADLMPSDITGAPMFDMKQQEFRFRAGPVFTQFLLADEINRAPAKTHAALLEIMQEFRVTVDGVSHALDRPFLVLATQNPIESEGTYNLPEAQLDRFMFKLVAEYPREQEEAEILKLHSRQIDINRRLEEELTTITTPEEIIRISQENANVRVDDRLVDYINKIVRLTRQWPQFHLGASPRAGLAMMQAARTLAAFSGRDYAVPDDVVQIAIPALRHRVMLTAEAEVEGQKVDDLLTALIRSVEVPRL